MKQYGQLVAKVSGILTQNGISYFTCINEGWNYQNGKDFTNVGECVGQFFSQTFDITF